MPEPVSTAVSSHTPGSVAVQKPAEVGIGMAGEPSKLKKRKRVKETGEPISEADTKRARLDGATIPAVAQPVTLNAAKPTTAFSRASSREERRKKVKRRRTQGF
ncbi:hypothetical protein IWQ62_002449 [Dispira parvispora]|uniref:Uncharacterized protein n=1 Tax=Dispira parvispora TaxID=1520584 RepID=A0A9W8AVQ0_9FUNG|nr:hypothetical protein IWQ62_002449 [Dispira parvispora]